MATNAAVPRRKKRKKAPPAEAQGAPAQEATRKRPIRRKRRWVQILNLVSKRRRIVQIGFAALVWLALSSGWITLGWLILAGGLLGVVLGKFFCRWMCPIGLMMDLMMEAGPDSQRNLYMYYKLGCPIAWISGFLNRFSLLRIRRRPESCVDCGLCDKACYVAAMDGEASLFKPGRRNASTFYACSRCLACVEACPTHALDLGPVLPLTNTVNERKSA